MLGELDADLHTEDEREKRNRPAPPAALPKLLEAATAKGAAKKCITSLVTYLDVMPRISDRHFLGGLFLVEDRAVNIGRKNLSAIRWAWLSYTMRTEHRFPAADAAANREAIK